MVGGMRRIVHETSAAGIDCTGHESEADVALMGDTLEGANEIGSFKILENSSVATKVRIKNSCSPLTRESIDL